MFDFFSRKPGQATMVVLGAAVGTAVVVGGIGLIVARIMFPPPPTPTGGFVPAIIIDVPPGRVDLGRGIPIKVRAEDSKGIDQIIILEDGQQAWSAQSGLSEKIMTTTFPWVPKSVGDHKITAQIKTTDNRLSDATVVLYAGCCPPPTELQVGYTVRQGDTPDSIALTFGICVAELRKTNPNIDTVKPGDVIYVPFDPRNSAGIPFPSACAQAGPPGGATQVPVEPGGSPFFDGSNVPPGSPAWPVAGTKHTSREWGCQPDFTGVKATAGACPADKPWFHPAIDITAPLGTPLTTLSPGVVVYAGPDVTSKAPCDSTPGSQPPHNGFGNYIRIDDPAHGLTYLYGHTMAIAVSTGDKLDAVGKAIGQVGSTGCSTGPHVHLQIYQNGRPIDPRSVLPQ